MNTLHDHLAAMHLHAEEITRYSRQIVLPEVGREGQKKLKAARVLIVGAGGLGSPAAVYLAAAGVGRLGLADFDVVEATNLHRQILYGTSDLGRPKLEAARERLTDLNPRVTVTCHEAALTAANALAIAAGYDVVLDGTDNFATRYLVNDTCVLLNKPNVYGSVYRFEGQVSVFWGGRGPCYRCLFPAPPPPGQVPDCAEGGVLGILPGIVGTMQATEALKLILGAGEPLVGRLVHLDALAFRFHEFRIPRDPACPLCGANPTIRELIDYEAFCGGGPGARVEAMTAAALQARLTEEPPPVVLDVRDEGEWGHGRLAGARLIPLAELEPRLAELDPAAETIVYCQMGVRSTEAARLLHRAGFRHVRVLEGGLDAWAAAVDPGRPVPGRAPAGG